MLSNEEIDHIAKLARLELDQAHKDKFKKELSSILEYIDQLEQVDVSGVEPLYQVTGLMHQTRPDEHRGDFPMDERSADLLIGQAPMRQGRLIKVKAIKNA